MNVQMFESAEMIPRDELILISVLVTHWLKSLDQVSEEKSIMQNN